MHMFPLYFYFRFAKNRLSLAYLGVNCSPALWACPHVLLSSTSFPFDPAATKSSPQILARLACFGAFLRTHNTNVGTALWPSPFGQMALSHSFLLDVGLSVFNVPCSTPIFFRETRYTGTYVSQK